MFVIGSIIWPEDKPTAVRLYLDFLMNVLVAYEIRFSNEHNNPILITQKLLDGNPCEEAREAATEYWWGLIDERGAIREFRDKDILMARLAICLLAVSDKDAHQLGEHLSWFTEVLYFLGEDSSLVIEMMKAYFKVRN